MQKSTTSETGTDVSGGTTNSAQAVGYSSMTDTTAAPVPVTGNVTTGDAGAAIAAAALAIASVTAFVARKKHCDKQ
ncbi:MAG: hypothetical protein IKQ91_06405 [Oscillospiraceae bacterium]|nr:hypothetical protein [Oscillospiraceae bacterium]